ncbi:tyrosine-type recombinase/integrase [Roseomonas rosulenta]|uniref:tyrosine-type recombinase/integrase n=1 Tax=Roseomonas rosulenta TaxID=2748667 RepID=UPI0018DF692C|nr:integrase arm-type DNA-binding domain-containing protein [Roseomonas rosulenta]
MKVQREGPTKITKATVEAAWRRREPQQRLVISDQACPGLELVVNPGGKTWRFDYKPRGKDQRTGKRFATRSITIGSPETHSPEDARHAASQFKGQAKAGVDPAEARKAQATADALKRSQTLDRLVDDYAHALPSRPKIRGTGTITTRHATYEVAHRRAAVGAMSAGTRPAVDIGGADLRLLMSSSADHPATARHCLGALSRFFDWCQDDGLVRVNPCLLPAKARRPRPVAARQNFLSPTVLAALWKAAGTAISLGSAHRDLARFLMAIPCRRSEAAKLDWLQIDLEARVWTQRGKTTKNGDDHRFHLNEFAIGVLRERHRALGHPVFGLVFPAPISGKPIGVFSDMQTAFEVEANVKGWRWQDFRRSFATALGEIGLPEPAVDAVLNHRQAETRGGVLGVYQRATLWPAQVEALDAWGSLLITAIQERDALLDRQNVVMLAEHRPRFWPFG